MKEKKEHQTYLTKSSNINDLSEIPQIKIELIHAYRRTGFEFDADMDVFYEDLKTIFKGTSINSVIKAIENGSTGKYGRTYKMSFQEVCVWIRCYIEGCGPKDLGNIKSKY